jgi:hypothetical protein
MNQTSMRAGLSGDNAATAWFDKRLRHHPDHTLSAWSREASDDAIW